MSQDESMTFGDLLGRIDWLDIVCAKCDRHGRYHVHTLAAQLGHDYSIPDWVNDMTKDCPRRRAPGLADPCSARCPELLAIA
jgi:hypothetical protein